MRLTGIFSLVVGAVLCPALDHRNPGAYSERDLSGASEGGPDARAEPVVDDQSRDENLDDGVRRCHEADHRSERVGYGAKRDRVGRCP
jgi:hypothetical protein